MWLTLFAVDVFSEQRKKATPALGPGNLPIVWLVSSGVLSEPQILAASFSASSMLEA